MQDAQRWMPTHTAIGHLSEKRGYVPFFLDNLYWNSLNKTKVQMNLFSLEESYFVISVKLMKQMYACIQTNHGC